MPSWVYCGHRRPWKELINYNNATLFLKSRNVVKPPYLSILYEVCEHEFGAWKSYLHFHSIDAKEADKLYSTVLSKKHFGNSIVWKILASPGYNITFKKIGYKYMNAILSIYDGFEEFYKITGIQIESLHEISKFLPINCSTTYFHSRVRLDLVKTTYQNSTNPVFMLTFKNRQLGLQIVYPRSKKRVFSSNGILHSMYMIDILNQTDYANISFNIRKFDGWNERECSHGGYVIRQSIGNNFTSAFITYGPYCTSSLTVNPLISNNTWKFLVLGRYLLSAHKYYYDHLWIHSLIKTYI